MENCKDYSVTLQLDIMLFLKKKKKKTQFLVIHISGKWAIFSLWFFPWMYIIVLPVYVTWKVETPCFICGKTEKKSAFLTYSLIIMYFSSHEYNLFPFKLPFFTQLGSIVFAYRFMLLQMYFSVTWCKSRRQLLGNEISIVQTSSYGNYRSMFVLWWYSTVRNLGH